VFFLIAPLPGESIEFRRKRLFAVALLQRFDQIPKLPWPFTSLYVTEALGHEEQAVRAVEPHQLLRTADSCAVRTSAIRAFPVNLTPNSPSSDWPVIEELSEHKSSG
jgi:hypothetical protein